MSSSESEGGSEDDVQQELLKRLEKYGESLIDDTKQIKKSKLRRADGRKSEKIQLAGEQKKKKKKKRKQKQSEDDDNDISFEDFSDEEDEIKPLRGEQKHLENFKAMLGLTEEDIKKHKKSKETEKNGLQPVVVSDAMMKKNRKRPPPEIIVFEDPAKRKKGKSSRIDYKKKETKDAGPPEIVEFDLKRARHEVQRFGIRGFDKEKKEEAQVALAVKLGAIPPKNPYLNYKKLMEKKMREKSEAEDQHSASNDTRYQYGSTKKAKKLGRDKNDVGNVDGQIGRYKSGMQMLSSQEISAIKKSKVRR